MSGPIRPSGSCARRTGRRRRAPARAAGAAARSRARSRLPRASRRRPSARSSCRRRRPSGSRSPPGRCAPAGRPRARVPPRAGTRGSPAGASTAATSRAAARRSTSTGGSGRRTRIPGRCCRTTSRRDRAPSRGSSTSVMPWRRSSIAAAMPPNPLPRSARAGRACAWVWMRRLVLTSAPLRLLSSSQREPYALGARSATRRPPGRARPRASPPIPGTAEGSMRWLPSDSR